MIKGKGNMICQIREGKLKENGSWRKSEKVIRVRLRLSKSVG